MTLLSTQVTTMITTVGFPIAAFVMMFRFATVTVKENTKAIANLALVLAK